LRAVAHKLPTHTEREGKRGNIIVGVAAERREERERGGEVNA